MSADGEIGAPLAPLADAVRRFWPGGAVVSLAGRGGPGEYLVVPGAARPAMLLPSGSIPAARAAARGWGTAGAGPAAVLRRVALDLVLRAGLARWAFPDRLRVDPRPWPPSGQATGEAAAPGHASLIDLLGRRLEVTRPLLAIRTGSPRANRKPVLQVLTDDGTVLAFVKVGHDDLTRDLVRAEAAALRRVDAAGLTEVDTPQVLFAEPWQDLELLALAPMPPARGRRRPKPRLPDPAWLQVAGIDATSARLADAPFWARMADTPAQLDHPATADVAAPVRSLLARYLDRYADVELRLGGRHGDWTAWNMRLAPRPGHPDAVLLWDWERFDTGVPAGFDPLHHRFNDLRLVRGMPLPAAAHATLAEAPGLLAALQVDRAHADLIGRLYLLELALRYLLDGRHESGAGVLRHGRDLLAVLTDVSDVSDLTERSTP